MIYTLKNEFLEVKIATQGAELKSIWSIKNNTEYLWQGNPKFWAKSSPILFPIVGTLRDGNYTYQNRKYSLSRHGFARERKFLCLKHSEELAEFQLRDDHETYLLYPFHFQLIISYRLTDNRLYVTYTVCNPDAQKPLIFSIGGHPAFNVPIDSHLEFEDYALQFNKDNKIIRYYLMNGLLTDNSDEVILDEKGRLFLKEAHFNEDAWVIPNLQSDVITLFSPKDDKKIQLHQEGFPWFGLWKPLGAPFLCLEPWCGVSDHLQSTKEWLEKPSTIKLEPTSNFQKTWSLEIL